jgi:hypothetical protein
MRRRLLLLVSIVGLVFASGGIANAATGTTSSSTGHYCVAQAVPVGRSHIPIATCYVTFARAISAATKGRVHLAASAKPGSVTPDQLNAGAQAPVTTFVLSIDYKNGNFSGAALTWTQTSKCGSFLASAMPTNWNDTVSSVSAASGCATTLFWNNNFGSPTFPIARNGSASSLGVFNDQTSSQSWCTASPCGG